MPNVAKPRNTWVLLWILGAIVVCIHSLSSLGFWESQSQTTSVENHDKLVRPEAEPALTLLDLNSFTQPAILDSLPPLHIDKSEDPSESPSIFVLRPPKSLLMQLDKCTHVCNTRAEVLASEEDGEWEREWEREWKRYEDDEVEWSEKVEKAFGARVPWAERYPKEWPFEMLQTDQFSLPAALDLLFQNHATAFPGLSEASADFIYLALPTLTTALCFNRCPSADTRELLTETTTFIQTTLTDLSPRRQYPSLLMSLALIDHDYEKNFLRESMQKVYLDNSAVLMGIERKPWDTKELLQEKGRWKTLPYPSGLHLKLSDDPWQSAKLENWLDKRVKERTFLLSFAGKREPNSPNSGKGPHNGFAIRRHLTEYFDSVHTFNATYFEDKQESTRSLVDTPSSDSSIYFQLFTPGSQKADLLQVHLSMASSVFCLEPAGDSPTRKGFYESIILGCIPVLFRKDTYSDVFAGLLPWEGGNLEDVAVILDEEGLLSKRDEVNIVEKLRAVGKDEREKKQGMIREVAKLVQWGVPMEGAMAREGEDAFGMVLSILKKVMESSLVD